jgi:Tol biopolymer transport system component
MAQRTSCVALLVLGATWFPDGRHLAFQSDRSRALAIWSVDADSGDLRQLRK